MTEKAVLVIGGGISGIQASLDLASRGYKIYLVEKSPSIGGRMAQLDKTFPTMDCSMCILAPKMIDCSHHPNVQLLTYSEVKGIKGEPGNFIVTVLRNPRFVDETKCTGCGYALTIAQSKYQTSSTSSLECARQSTCRFRKPCHEP